MSKQITKNEYLQLLGLESLARKYNALLTELDNLAIEIIQDDKSGHTSDWIYGATNLDEMLNRLKIEVIK